MRYFWEVNFQRYHISDHFSEVMSAFFQEMANKKLSEKLPQPGEFIITKKAEYEVTAEVYLIKWDISKLSSHNNLTRSHIQHTNEINFFHL